MALFSKLSITVVYDHVQQHRNDLQTTRTKRWLVLTKCATNDRVCEIGNCKDKTRSLFVYLFILGRKLNRQNCLLKEVLREREEKEEKEKKKSN